MILSLYNTTTDPRKIAKSLSLVRTVNGNIKNQTEVVKPVILMELSDPPDFNYVYIRDFVRYYFLRDARLIRAGLWEVVLECDVLMSFNLSGVSGVVKETQETGGNDYLEGRHFVSTVKDKTDIVVFPNGLLESGEYILITAGGGS